MNALQCMLAIGLVSWGVMCLASDAYAYDEGAANARTGRETSSDASTAEASVGPVHSARAWVGRALRAEDGKDAGRVEDFAFDLEEGCVAFVLVKPADARPDDQSRLGLPIELLSASNSDKTLSVHARSKAIQRAPRLQRADWAETVTRLWAIDVYESFQLESPWERRQQLQLWSLESQYGRKFDPRRLRRVEGRIAGVDYLAPLPGMSAGAQLTLESGDKTWRVHVGPLGFLSEQDMTFAQGEDVSVTDSEVTLGDEPVLIATDIQVGDRKLKLREKNGAAVWQGWTAEDESRHFVRWSELSDLPVTDADGKAIGNIRDFALSDRGNSIAYAAVTFLEESKAKTDGEAKRLHAIPLGAFVVKPGVKAWELELPEGILADAPGFSGDKWPDKIGRGWIEYVHVRYGRSAVGGVRSEEKRADGDSQ